jgi:hypothetical protein
MTIPFCLLGSELDSLITLLPGKKFFPQLTASGTAHRISYSKDLTRSGFIGSMGGAFPLATLNYRGVECQTVIASSIYTTLANQHVKFDVQNVDFYVDLFFDLPLREGTVLRFGWGHTSHHLVDDEVVARTERNGNVLPYDQINNYAREDYKLFVAQELATMNLFVYAGIHNAYSFLLDDKKNQLYRIDGQWLFETGGEGNTSPLIGPVSGYAAFDIKFRGELSYGTTQSYQVGIKAEQPEMRAVRLAYTYRTGLEERGQYYNQRITIQSIGVYFDF